MGMTVVVMTLLYASHCSLVPADDSPRTREPTSRGRWLTWPTGLHNLQQDTAVNRQGPLTMVPSQYHRRVGIA
ncbi:hypothetical protein EDD15DRAFT_2308776 [Pisolithus albus]|nr:hypothetical protein EDD15DRAFT_2308776 [Pisolithus albus]